MLGREDSTPESRSRSEDITVAGAKVACVLQRKAPVSCPQRPSTLHRLPGPASRRLPHSSSIKASFPRRFHHLILLPILFCDLRPDLPCTRCWLHSDSLCRPRRPIPKMPHPPAPPCANVCCTDRRLNLSSSLPSSLSPLMDGDWLSPIPDGRRPRPSTLRHATRNVPSPRRLG